MTPKPKPKNYSKILDVLNTPQAAKTFSPKTYIDLVGQYSRKAYDNNEISKKEYMDIVKPLFGETGVMATKAIEEYRSKFGGGGKSNYWSMVTKMFLEAGGEEATGMSINDFAAKYFPKMAQGGRIGYSEGSPDTAELRKRVEELMDDGETFGDAVKKAVKELENG